MHSTKSSKFEKDQKKGKGDQKDLIRYINLQLAAMGQPIFKEETQEGQKSLSDSTFIELTDSLIQNYRAKSRLLGDTFVRPISVSKTS